MKNRERPHALRKWIAALSCCILLAALLMVWLAPARVPPSVSIAHLGYTNGVGPHALLAITNRSDFAITLEPTCLVSYSSSEPAAVRRVTSIEPNTLRVTRLPPREGFVQSVFVFPASQGDWQFECSAAYSSRWLEVQRFAVNQVRKALGRAKLPKASYKFATEWQTCP